MRTTTQLLVATFILCVGNHAHAASDARSPVFIVWNVGQGLWATWMEAASCTHFDMGGERAPWQRLQTSCGHHQNRAHFSHWDWDHVSFVRQAARKLGALCIDTPPGGEAPAMRRGLFKSIPLCGTKQDNIKEVWDGESRSDRSITQVQRGRGVRAHHSPRLSSNDASRVFVLLGSVLLPGDSTKSIEMQWARSERLAQVSILVLGHHGSQTSTSEDLLNQLPSLRQAVASARKEKHGHPHRSVVSRLKRRGIAVIGTEDWGTIRFELRSAPSRVINSVERSP